jgi:hypothetical protein
MIELRNDGLRFRFPEVHEEATFKINFQRTLRIPDDGHEYPLPPGLGAFPLRHVDDYADSVPDTWIEHGGVMLPMYQAEAMWLNFGGDYPMAVKIATGKVNAVTGERWVDGINRNPQDYVVLPDQPWLDGYSLEKGSIRQFVAMPLGSGYSVEEQMTGDAEHGGIQIVAYPMKAEYYERFRRRASHRLVEEGVCYCASPAPETSFDMGLAPGGRMRQKIYDDPHEMSAWDLRHPSRCFVHIANSLAWREVTGDAPPTDPPTARDYTHAGLPWFDLYDDDKKALAGADRFKSLKSVADVARAKREPLSENESLKVERVVKLRKGMRKEEVRVGEF